ncbi:HAD family hydrolase [Rhizobium sp. KVB221]|uniref:HAD family hydrolase n=1 Tax=Rhizobium setariae TaxID=2801340 RepID=A0A936YR66_9HYPH|nr:HAD family hydrolase [Rhizobium setariae]MBL0370845.1 HAD family hydrolase [Rhizobium setariae]
MSGIDLILFDCDGVLVDSEIIAAEVESKLLRDSGFEITAEDMCVRFAGLDWKNILLAIEKESELPLSASLIDKSERILDQTLARRVKIIDGVRTALARITEQRCICSNSSSQRLDMMLTKVGLKPYFEGHIYSAKDLGPDRTKPKPDIYLHGAQQFGVDPSRCLVIEDSVHGVHAARAAGMRVIGFTGGSHTYPTHADRLTDAGAETVISRMIELPQMVEALKNWTELA